MKRECLLSAAYIGTPMQMKGVELYYSPLVNEVLRTLETPFFTGAGNDVLTDHAAMCEAIMVMFLISSDKKDILRDHMAREPKERRKALTEFYLDHEEDIDRLKSELIKRMEQALASNVESEAGGKSP